MRPVPASVLPDAFLSARPGLVLACLWVLLLPLLSGCGAVLHRTAGFTPATADCQALYERVDDPAVKGLAETERDSPCWRRAREERRHYDSFFIEFDDQGWIRDSAQPRAASEPAGDFLDRFFAQLEEIHRAQGAGGVSLIVFVHGWHHNAAAGDDNVVQFRRLLRDLDVAERQTTPAGEAPMRAVGLYVGWRGQSLDLPYLEHLSFWERKNTAERVAQGSVRELFSRLDRFHDQHRQPQGGLGAVRMLTVGHSFGGLITYEALGGEFLRSAVDAGQPGQPLSRMGDLVVLVNPALEGARFEPLRAAGQRQSYAPGQLPSLIVATSTGDLATRVAFPAARRLSTLFETTEGPQSDSIVRTVGHNPRYITHRLDRCGSAALACERRCDPAVAASPQAAAPGRGVGAEGTARAQLAAEVERALSLDLVPLARQADADALSLAGDLALCRNEAWQPAYNPFWVVQTSPAVISDHNDIFNPHFTSFIRQIYTAVRAQAAKAK